MTRNAMLASFAALSIAAAFAGTARAQSLPAGSVTLYGGNATAANFLIDDTVVRDGSRVTFSNMRVYAELIEVPGGPIAMDVTRLVIDCTARTATVQGIDTFKASGDHVVSFPGEPVRPIETDDTWDYAARVLCDGMELPPQQTRSDWRDGRAFALSMMGR